MWWWLCRWRSLQYQILSVKIFYIKRILLIIPSKMDMDRDKMAERILHLTLEILFRLTGEDYTVVKKTSRERCEDPVSEGWGRPLSPITGPPPHPLIHEDINDQKILELAYKMIELLTGEVPIRCQDVAVYFSMEEWEYLEGHKDLYKDVMMEVPQPLTSPDLSSKRTTPERYPRPLLPQDCKQEEPNVPQDHQGEDLTHINTTETYVRGDERCKEDIPTDNRPVCSIMNNVQCAVVSAALLVEEAQRQDEARMVARKRANPWGDAEVRYLIAELDARDYECHEHPGHPVLHKQAVLWRISRGLAQRFGVQRSTTQIRKKLADLRFRSSDRITSIRSQTLPHRGEWC
ncbi:uncharacterized protein [Phyllobates terribilis]|uniref:uncharacterized protein n=1 Tax=Phyllobates terribilis TaxID=111132 RepID=UPI003CCAC3D5